MAGLMYLKFETRGLDASCTGTHDVHQIVALAERCTLDACQGCERRVVAK